MYIKHAVRSYIQQHSTSIFVDLCTRCTTDWCTHSQVYNWHVRTNRWHSAE